MKSHQVQGRIAVRARKLAAFTALLLWGAAANASWWNHDWSFRKQIVLDGTQQGAAMQGELAEAPVLLRLHEGVFRFADANVDGSDLRFVADDDKTPLKFHIEKYDNVFNMAFVWVQVPKLGASEPVHIWMYYGNAKSVSGSEPKATYDNNQKLVYHFGERGSPVQDATSYLHHAVSAVAVDESGLIGNAARFDGSSVVVLPATPALNHTAGAALTWSAWIKPGSKDATAVIYAKRDSGRSFVLGLNKGAAYVGVGDGPGALQMSPPAPAIADENWHHLAVIASAAQTTLYLDGQARASLARGLPALTGAATLGGQGGINGTPVESPYTGELDELRLASIARDAALIQFETGNQGTGDKLVSFGVDEAQSSWSTGYVGIILGSVTLDGWVIIGILIVMMLISWVIMAKKGWQIGRISRSNAAFMGAFRRSRGDFAALRAATLEGSGGSLDISDDAAELLEDSPLLHMFRAGIEELEQRLNHDRGSGRRRTYLSAQSIEAIRATLDSSLVLETQTLTRLMVLLTIAISGGPFIGLLGTVVGVMITFAAVAAAGDVNINAIAPGIAAALAATVAGLFVAIPALFGYNYLITRIKECTAEMQMFVDSFITRMAENYNDPDALQALAER